jgi:hypothetical protein
MTTRIALFLLLLTTPSLATTEGICTEFDEDFFGPDIYIITEFDDPRELPLSVLYQYTLKKNELCGNGCNPLAEHNAYWMASEELWSTLTTTQGIIVRHGCGGESRCLEPVYTENVRCIVERGDCDYEYSDPYTHIKILETFYLECRGDQNCSFEDRPATDCCIVVGVETWKT